MPWSSANDLVVGPRVLPFALVVPTAAAEDLDKRSIVARAWLRRVQFDIIDQPKPKTT